MAKKLSVVQLKQQANVLKSLEAVEQAAAVLYADFVGCWFSMEFENFPGSLLVRCQFNSETALAAALEQKLDESTKMFECIDYRYVIFFHNDKYWAAFRNRT
mgnify:CR=1 FL=1